MSGPGHNSAQAEVVFTLKLFNSLAGHADFGPEGLPLSLPAGASLADLCAHLGLATRDVALVLVNGADISPGRVDDPVRTDYYIQQGDVVALSGPVPYSWGYGSPVV